MIEYRRHNKITFAYMQDLYARYFFLLMACCASVLSVSKKDNKKEVVHGHFVKSEIAAIDVLFLPRL